MIRSAANRCTVPLLLAFVVACNKPATTPSLPSPQTFNFAAQPIVFSPPPAGWEPEGELSGGVRGTRYVKRNSVGEAITIGNYYDVSGRLKQAEIANLLTVNSDYASSQFDHALRQAWCSTTDPYSDLETVAAVQELWRTGRVDEAKVRLRSVPLRSALLPSLAPPSDFALAWSKIRYASEQTPYENVAANFAVIAAGLDATSPPDLAAIVDWALPRVDRIRLTSTWHLSGGPFDGEENDASATRPDAQSRDIVWRKSVTVDGRNAEEIETWDNLTHAQPRRLLFLVNNDHLLVVTSEFGGREHSIRGYETVRASLHLLP